VSGLSACGTPVISLAGPFDGLGVSGLRGCAGHVRQGCLLVGRTVPVYQRGNPWVDVLSQGAIGIVEGYGQVGVADQPVQLVFAMPLTLQLIEERV